MAVAVGSVPTQSEILEVEVQGPSGVLAGTPLIPDTGDPSPLVVVFISGSGPQDRDSTLFGHKPFLQVAEALAERGVASLRCDDRGVGASKGDRSKATSLDYAEDAKAQLRYLIDDRGFDLRHVGIVGHSEGGMIGAFLAAGPNPPIAFAVLMAGPGISGGAVITGQTEDLFRAARVDPGLARVAVERNRALIDAVGAGAGEPEVRPLVREFVRAQIECDTGHAPAEPAVDEATRELAVALVNPWMRNWIRMDPAPAYARCAVPTLALFGGDDRLVSPERNVGPIEKASRDAPVKPEIVVFNGLNHLFQKSGKGTEDYAAIKTGVEPEVLEKIAVWVSER